MVAGMSDRSEVDGLGDGTFFGEGIAFDTRGEADL
jgi:hypothetical protein